MGSSLRSSRNCWWWEWITFNTTTDVRPLRTPNCSPGTVALAAHCPNSKYGSPYLATCHFTFLFFFLSSSVSFVLIYISNKSVHRECYKIVHPKIQFLSLFTLIYPYAIPKPVCYCCFIFLFFFLIKQRKSYRLSTVVSKQFLFGWNIHLV